MSQWVENGCLRCQRTFPPTYTAVSGRTDSDALKLVQWWGHSESEGDVPGTAGGPVETAGGKALGHVWTRDQEPAAGSRFVTRLVRRTTGSVLLVDTAPAHNPRGLGRAPSVDPEEGSHLSRDLQGSREAPHTPNRGSEQTRVLQGHKYFRSFVSSDK